MLKEILNRRFACKHFDTERKIPTETLNQILEETILTPTAYGLQPWQFLVIQNQNVKNTLSAACFKQPQITECSDLIILCANTNFLGENGLIDQYIKQTVASGAKTLEEMEGYKQMCYNYVNSLDPAKQLSWAQKQLYLAGQTLMISAMEKGVDSCPMEGFMPMEIKKLLELPEHLTPSLIIPLGYAAMPVVPKTRFPLQNVVKYL